MSEQVSQITIILPYVGLQTISCEKFHQTILIRHILWGNLTVCTGVVFWGFPRSESSPSAHLRMRDPERNGWYLSLIFWEFPPRLTVPHLPCFAVLSAECSHLPLRLHLCWSSVPLWLGYIFPLPWLRYISPLPIDHNIECLIWYLK